MILNKLKIICPTRSTLNSAEYYALGVWFPANKIELLLRNTRTEGKCVISTLANVSHNGYTVLAFRLAGKKINAKTHRLSYELFVGPIGDLCVCHKCDTPACINPDCLWLGTELDNVEDRHSKGRTAYQVSEEDLAKMDVLIREGKLYLSDIAKRIGVAHSYVVNRKKKLESR